MPVVEYRALGKWLRAIFHSTKSDSDYEVQCHWEEGQWVAISCTCRGFGQHLKCYHLKETEQYLRDVEEPAPRELPGNTPLKLNFWYHCAVCRGSEFMLRPFSAGFATPDELHDSHPDDLTVVCCQCGRMYKL